MEPTPPPASPRPEIQFHFIKSHLFRVIYAEGAVGGVSPKGLIQMTLFNERVAIPNLTVVEGTPEAGGLRPGKEIMAKREGKNGIVRELEAEIMMSLQSAKSLHTWLGNHIATLEQMEKNAVTTTAGKQS
jgi:hypothetical protein